MSGDAQKLDDVHAFVDKAIDFGPGILDARDAPSKRVRTSRRLVLEKRPRDIHRGARKVASGDPLAHSQDGIKRRHGIPRAGDARHQQLAGDGRHDDRLHLGQISGVPRAQVGVSRILQVGVHVPQTEVVPSSPRWKCAGSRQELASTRLYRQPLCVSRG